MPNITLGNSGIYGIARGIASNTKIRKLSLSSNELNHFGMDFLVTEGLMLNDPSSTNYSEYDTTEIETGRNRQQVKR